MIEKGYRQGPFRPPVGALGVWYRVTRIGGRGVGGGGKSMVSRPEGGQKYALRPKRGVFGGQKWSFLSIFAHFSGFSSHTIIFSAFFDLF